MAFAGLRGTGDFGANERPEDFRNMILWLQPNGTAPMFALSARGPTEKASDPHIHWWEEKKKLIRVQLDDATDMTSGDTAMVLASEGDADGSGGLVAADGLYLVPGDLLLVEKTETGTYDNEIVEVTAVTDANNITISRGAAGTTAAAITDDTFLTKIGNAFEEGSDAPEVSLRNPTELENYCQIFKTAFEETGTTLATELRTGDPLQNDMIRKSFDHSAALEFAWMFGRRHSTTGTNGKPKRYMGGILDPDVGISSNRTIFSSAVSTSDFLDAIAPVFDNNASTIAGDERIMFVGNGALNEINKIFESSVQFQVKDVLRVYGQQLTRVITPLGTIGIKSHPLLSQNSLYTNSAIIYDPTAVKWRPLRDTRKQDNIQNNDKDSRKGQWLTEGTIEVNHESTMAYLGNISAT